MDINALIAEQQKKLVARSILDEFLEIGTGHLAEGDIPAALEEVDRAYYRFKRCGIDIEQFLETGRV